MTYFTGIDVSLRSVSICIVDENGKVCHEAKVPAQPAAIAQCLEAFSVEAKCVGLEAGTLTQYLTYGLQGGGVRGRLHGIKTGEEHLGVHAQQD